jgi:protein-L-isoaspartate(D-aspartate) O-methyltransferase
MKSALKRAFKKSFLLVITAFVWFAILESGKAMDSENLYTFKRLKMIKDQIEARGIKDKRLLDALASVPRHLFVPDTMKEYAYEDGPLPIGEQQTISQPFIVAYMIEAATINPGDRVLEIGTGSGYNSAVLSKLANEVYTIELIEELSKSAFMALKHWGCKNVFGKVGDGYEGWKEKSPFDVIIVTAAAEHIPSPLIDQLKPGGRLIIPVGRANAQEIVRVKKLQAGVTQETLLPVSFVPFKRK